MSSRFLATAWAQELASHGIVVVALDHPYDSAVIVTQNGHVIRSSARATGDEARDNENALRWTRIRTADLRYTLDRLLTVRGNDPDVGFLAGRIDPRQFVVAGHSLGGAAALLAASEDPRFAAAIAIDGFPRGLSEGPPTQPVLAVVAGRGTGDPAGDQAYAHAIDHALSRSTAGIEVTVPGATHLTFTDAPLFLAPLPGIVGDGPRTHGPQLTAGLTRALLTGVAAGLPRDELARTLTGFGLVST